MNDFVKKLAELSAEFLPEEGKSFENLTNERYQDMLAGTESQKTFSQNTAATFVFDMIAFHEKAGWKDAAFSRGNVGTLNTALQRGEAFSNQLRPMFENAKTEAIKDINRASQARAELINIIQELGLNMDVGQQSQASVTPFRQP